MQYRCQFGQNLSIVGGPGLGDWNPDQGIALQWSEGDAWIGEAEIQLGCVCCVLLESSLSCMYHGFMGVIHKMPLTPFMIAAFLRASHTAPPWSTSTWS